METMFPDHFSININTVVAETCGFNPERMQEKVFYTDTELGLLQRSFMLILPFADDRFKIRTVKNICSS